MVKQQIIVESSHFCISRLCYSRGNKAYSEKTVDKTRHSIWWLRVLWLCQACQLLPPTCAHGGQMSSVIYTKIEMAVSTWTYFPRTLQH